MPVDQSAEIARVAAAYPPEAANVPASERDHYFTDIQRAAWSLRFAAAEPTVAETDMRL